MPQAMEIITGISLYNCTEDVDFVHEYKKQIEILIPVSNMFLFVEKNASPIMNYRTLCEFKELAQKVALVFDIDMTERYGNFIDSYKEEITFLNFNLSRLTDLAMEHLYTEESLKHIVNISDDCFIFDLESKSKLADIVNMYSDEFNKLRM
jgi:hypothetical protein